MHPKGQSDFAGLKQMFVAMGLQCLDLRQATQKLERLDPV
jgi:hypothetical protein